MIRAVFLVLALAACSASDGGGMATMGDPVLSPWGWSRMCNENPEAFSCPDATQPDE